jgi:hypothetical protein
MDATMLYTARVSRTRGPEPRMAGKWGEGAGSGAEALGKDVRELADVV